MASSATRFIPRCLSTSLSSGPRTGRFLTVSSRHCALHPPTISQTYRGGLAAHFSSWTRCCDLTLRGLTGELANELHVSTTNTAHTLYQLCLFCANDGNEKPRLAGFVVARFARDATTLYGSDVTVQVCCVSDVDLVSYASVTLHMLEWLRLAKL